MKTLFTKKIHIVGTGQAVSGVAASACLLRLTQGLAWVTVEGMADDFWLAAGQTLEVPGGKLVVVEAADGPRVVAALTQPAPATPAGIWAWLRLALARRFPAPDRLLGAWA